MSHAANGIDFAKHPFVPTVASYSGIVATCASKIATEIVLVFHAVFYNYFIASYMLATLIASCIAIDYDYYPS